MAKGPGPRVALVSREVAPFGGGGIGRYISALARLLSQSAQVTIFTTSRHQRAYAKTRREAPDSLPPARVVFVKEPRAWDARSSYNVLHAWSARVHEALLVEYGPDGPDLVEFPDFLGEGCVTVQAKRTASAAFARTTICVRAHGSAEMYDVLDGFLPREQERSFTHELERYALRYADRLLWAGGDILGTYERFYGEAELAPARMVRHPFAWDASPAARVEVEKTGPLRMLYLGRIERRKGVRSLVDAVLGLENPQWRLTMVGGDTETAPLAASMRALLEAELAGDPRVRLISELPRADIPALIDSHDVVVVPSLWECWPYVALEALERGCPLVATPTGGLTEIVVDPDTGRLAADSSADELAGAIAPLVDDPELARDHDPAASAELFAELTDPQPMLDGYLELARATSDERRVANRGRRSAGAASDAPLVSIVIPYFELPTYIEEAVASVDAQTHPKTEIVIVNDGSFRREDEILLELAERDGVSVVTQPNSGLGAARNLGIILSRGEYVLPLDADNLIEPGFVARCVAALEADPEIAYVTAWLRYIDAEGRPWKGTDEGLRPLGNSSRAIERLNVGGDAVAVFRRSVFEHGLAYSTDLAAFEDWTLYREMRARGLIGHVIPGPLIGYRLRDDSMMRTAPSTREQWVRQAIDAHLVERAIEWTAPPR